MTANLPPVTIGNVVGGALMVGAIYWFVYLRTVEDVPSAQPVGSGRHLISPPESSRVALLPGRLHGLLA